MCKISYHAKTHDLTETEYFLKKKTGLLYEVVLFQLIFFGAFGVGICLHFVAKAVGNKSLQAFTKLTNHETDFTYHLLCEGHIKVVPHFSKASAHSCKSLFSYLYF